MANLDSERRAREYAIDQLCAEYADAVESGRRPDIEGLLARYPQYAAELADFIASYHLTLPPLPELDDLPATPAAQLSPGSARALEQVRAELARRAAAQATVAAMTFASLEDRAFDVGSTPEAVAQKVGLTQRLLARLDAHAVTAASIPRELFRRLAEALDISEQAVMAHLGVSPQAGGAFFDADQAPTGAQEDFLAAIEASDLDSQRKAEWRAMSVRDAQEGQP